ncbi:helix-turn-helix domain-containing protein [Thalassobacillus devorans]|uniref:helix-turn-helix domain-containing protein n=1 Tax=Thalassobacillus devorans TaxID=279813 RepID=UPI00048C4E67|nr:helix-turn-helix domain-containing protein [Thalassobacillus devorans]
MKNMEGSLQQLKEEYQKAHRDMMNLMESFQAISSTLNLEEVLKKIMCFTTDIFKSANAGYIQLYDSVSEKLVVKAYTGFNENIQSFKVRVGESITGKVFKDGFVKLIYTEKEIYGSMDNLSKENFDHLQKAQLYRQDIKSLMSVPISYRSKRIGVMTLHCYDTEEGLSETDLLLLQSFTSQAAIAIHNAQLHSDVQESLNEITSLSEKLQEANDLLARRTEIHNLLTRLSIQNKGLNVVLTEMNQMMENSVIYADYLEGKHHPQHKRPMTECLDDIFLLFAGRTEPAYVTVDGQWETTYYVHPIRSGTVFLGCIMTIKGTALSQLDRLIIEQGVPILALEVMKQRSQTEIKYKKTYERYHQFLSINNPQQAEMAANDLGISLHSYIQTTIIELDGNVDLHALENETLLLLAHLKSKVGAKNSLLFSYNNKITFFYSTDNASSGAYMRKAIQESIEWWNERYTVSARAGISSGDYIPGQAKKNQEKAEQALLYLKKQNKKGVLHYRDIGISRLFINHPPEDIDMFLHETLAPLWTEGDKHSDLFHTLCTYVQNNRSMAVTAKDLHIHTNTLYHRIKKIEELLNITLNEYKDYLKVQLSVYLYQTFHE